MERIDLNTWERREAFAFFSGMDWPFYSVTIPIDVTEVKASAWEQGLSFYYLMVWVCTKAVNSVPAFRLRVRGDSVVRLERADPRFTVRKPWTECFQIITTPWQEDPAAFCRDAAGRTAGQTAFLQREAEGDGLIYFSCTPWFDFTGLTHERTADRDDTIPRLCWGQYQEERDRLWLHLAVDVNHRTIDGFHIGQLKKAIDQEIALLGEEAE